MKLFEHGQSRLAASVMSEPKLSDHEFIKGAAGYLHTNDEAIKFKMLEPVLVTHTP